MGGSQNAHPLARMCQSLHSGFDGVHREHDCMLRNTCHCSSKQVLQGMASAHRAHVASTRIGKDVDCSKQAKHTLCASMVGADMHALGFP